MDYVTAWVTWLIGFFVQIVNWLGSMEILGVSVLWILAGSFFFAVIVRSLTFKP